VSVHAATTVTPSIEIQRTSSSQVTAKIGLQIPKQSHIYSQTPGSTGQATRIEWALPPEAVHPRPWPTPAQFKMGPIASDGYSGSLTVFYDLDIPLSVESIHATMSWVVCSDSCVPERTTVSARIPTSITHHSVQNSSALWPLVYAICFGLLGGMILNLMPCVFPVVSLKLLSIATLTHSAPRENRRETALFSAGIMVSTLVIGSGLLLLKATGSAVGWGYQLQSTAVVSILLILFFVIGLNLLGLFEVGLAASRLPGIAVISRWGSFGSGMIVTAVATPCTAPFMGTAIGIAATLSPLQALSIFMSIGVGMIVPYWIVAAIPSLVRWIPKPGAWMVTFKQFLAFPMFASVIWLEWVLYRQTQSPVLFLVVHSACLVSACFFWLYGKNQNNATWRSIIGLLIGITSLLSIPFYVITRQFTLTTSHSSTQWRPFSPAAVSAALQENKIVFIDFTAAWCLTCQFNEATVFRLPDVQAALNQPSVQKFRADWTNRQPEIATELSRYGRNGVPLYVILRPHHEPVILPQTPSPTDIITHLK